MRLFDEEELERCNRVQKFVVDLTEISKKHEVFIDKNKQIRFFSKNKPKSEAPPVVKKVGVKYYLRVAEVPMGEREEKKGDCCKIF